MVVNKRCNPRCELFIEDVKNPAVIEIQQSSVVTEDVCIFKSLHPMEGDNAPYVEHTGIQGVKEKGTRRMKTGRIEERPKRNRVQEDCRWRFTLYLNFKSGLSAKQESGREFPEWEEPDNC